MTCRSGCIPPYHYTACCCPCYTTKVVVGAAGYVVLRILLAATTLVDLLISTPCYILDGVSQFSILANPVVAACEWWKRVFFPDSAAAAQVAA